MCIVFTFSIDVRFSIYIDSKILYLSFPTILFALTINEVFKNQPNQSDCTAIYETQEHTINKFRINNKNCLLIMTDAIRYCIQSLIWGVGFFDR